MELVLVPACAVLYVLTIREINHVRKLRKQHDRLPHHNLDQPRAIVVRADDSNTHNRVPQDLDSK